jgi:hypothetical protein
MLCFCDVLPIPAAAGKHACQNTEHHTQAERFLTVPEKIHKKTSFAESIPQKREV